MKKLGFGYLMILMSATGFGMMNTIAKLAYACGLNVATLVSLRFSLAAVAFWGIVFAFRLPWRVTRRQFTTLALLGVFSYAAMSQLLFTSYTLLPASIASLLFYTYPFLVMSLERMLGLAPLNPTKVIAAFVAIVGLVNVLHVGHGAFNRLGMVLAFGTALIYALFITFGELTTSSIPVTIRSTYIVTFAALGLLGFGLATRHLHLAAPTQRGWVLCLAIAVVSTVIPIAAFYAGVHRIGPSSAAVTSMLEPVVTVIMSVMVFAENLSRGQWFGLMMVVGGSCLLHLRLPLRTYHRYV